MSNRTHKRALYKVTYEYEAELSSSNGYGEVERTGERAWMECEEYIIGPWGPSGPPLVQAWVSTRWGGQYRNFVVTSFKDIDGEINGAHY